MYKMMTENKCIKFLKNELIKMKTTSIAYESTI